MSNRMGKLFVVSSPSGGGKTTLTAEVLARNTGLVRSISMTTRSPRMGEENNKDYIFVSEEAFENIKRQDGFLEYATVFGHQYGTPREFVEDQRKAGKDVLLVIDVQGAMIVKKKCPDAALVFIKPPSFEELEKRLRDRGTDSERDIHTRLVVARGELEKTRFYDYCINNDNLAVAVTKLAGIIAEEHDKSS